KDWLLKEISTYLFQQIAPNIIPVIGWLYTIANYFMKIKALIGKLEGGTPIRIQRFAGYCADVPETFASVRVTHTALSMSSDVLWDAVVEPNTQYVRALYQRLLGRAPSCDELRSAVSSYPMLNSNGKWLQNGAYAFTKAITCDWGSAPGRDSDAIRRAGGTQK